MAKEFIVFQSSALRGASKQAYQTQARLRVLLKGVTVKDVGTTKDDGTTIEKNTPKKRQRAQIRRMK
ncbi:MAG: hypothetical protein WCA78_02155 [Rhizomicrobium sp.]